NTSLNERGIAMFKTRYARRSGNQRSSGAQCLIGACLVGALMTIPLPSIFIARGSSVGTNPEKVSQAFMERVHPGPSTQTIYAPLGLGKSYEAEIVLNNNSPGNMDVTAAFYTAEERLSLGGQSP